MRITNKMNIHQLSFLPRVFPVNCYLVDEEDGLTLIDTALPSSSKAILQAADNIGKPITRIVLTHAHDDHVGALDALRLLLPEATVYISERDARLLAGDVTLDPGETMTPIRGGVPKKVTTRPDVTLREGDCVGSLVAIAVPGHTPGSMAFQDSRTDAIIAGDALQTRGGLAVSGQVNWTFPFPAMATWSKQDALRSARKLRELKPTLIAVGHGEMLADPCAAMDHAIVRAARKLEGSRS